MKKHTLTMMILIITLTLFLSCSTEPQYHTVTLDYDIEWLPAFNITVKDGECLYPPKEPKNDGCTFGGWVTENWVEFSFSTPVRSDMRIKAFWIYPCTVTLKDREGYTIREESVDRGTLYKLTSDILGYSVNSCTDEEGNSVKISDGSVKILDKDTTLQITEKGDYRTYEIGEKGPGGGYIVYDADNPSSSGTMMHMPTEETSETLGWRYIEMAEKDLSGSYVFGYLRDSDNGENSYVSEEDDEHKKIGSGRTNTSSLVEAMGETAYTTETGNDKAVYAALAASLYDGGGFCDWYLPSSDEAFSLMGSLYNDYKTGNITENTDYWTSTEWKNSEDEQDGASKKAYTVDFGTGISGGPKERSQKYLVRPFRSF